MISNRREVARGGNAGDTLGLWDDAAGKASSVYDDTPAARVLSSRELTLRNIPAELRARPQWVAARIAPDPDRPGKTKKLPVDPHTGKAAKSNDPATWGSFEQAVARMEHDVLEAVGYVFAADDPYCGLDFDHVLDAGGDLDQWARDYLRLLDSYAERSQSGTGVHVIVRATLPPGGRHGAQVEMYTSVRFFIMTGDVIDGYTEIRDAQDAVNLIHRETFGASKPTPQPATHPAQPVTLADAELIAKAQAARNGHIFTALWAGSTVGYLSHSEADAALCSLLGFWAGGDAGRVDSLFRQSGLMREKWDARHYADGRTYGEATIANALARVTEFYDGNGRQPPDLPPMSHRQDDEPPAWLDADGAELPPMPSAPHGGSRCDPDARPNRGRGGLLECQPLSVSAQFDPELGCDASPRLDAYLDFSRLWAPRAYDGFHENAALWVLSTVAARRVQVDLGGPRFTNLYLANVARSSVWTKSTAHKIGAEVIDAAGLRFLLAPDDATPAALLLRMARQAVTDWDNLPVEDRERSKLRIGFAAQKGWDHDELGQKVSAMMRDSGPMADFRGILRRLDDCPKSYEYATIAHGSTMLERPYLSLLGSMTPADMAPYAKRGGALWNDGFWARFAFSAPAPEDASTMGRFPIGARVIPHNLVTPLRNWHNLLGAPSVEVIERSETDDTGKPKGKKWDTRVGPLPVQVCVLGAGVFEAFYRYFDALMELARQSDNTDLDGNYSRFAEKALRVAALLGSLENGGLIELRHWARAQAIAERWRQSLHNLYRTLNGENEESRTEDRIVNHVRRLGTATPVDVSRYVKSAPATTIAATMEGLARAGVLRIVGKTHKGTVRYTVVET